MKRYIFIGLVLTSTQASAQNAEIEAILSRALSEQQLMQTCSATLGSQTEDILVGYYSDNAAEVIAALDNASYASPQVEEMRRVADTGLLRLPDDTPFGDVLAYCNANPDWSSRMSRFELFNAAEALYLIGVRP